MLKHMVWILKLGSLALLASYPVAQAGELKLAPGDVLELSAAGIPNFRYKAAIDPDGEVSFPLVGQIKAAGLTLKDFTAELSKVLPTKAYRRRLEDGREFPTAIEASEINITVAEYRPIYVNGDVSKPGDVVFRPGMTVRQAVSLAGGYDLRRFRANDPFLEGADLRAKYESLWTQFAREQVRKVSLEAEAQGKTDIDFGALGNTPIAPSVINQLRGLELKQLRSRLDDYNQEQAYLRDAIDKEETRIATVRQQLAKETEGVEADNGELARVEALLEKGQVPITRKIEARRSILLSSTRMLQTAAQLSSYERESQNLKRKLSESDSKHKMLVQTELQDCILRLNSIQSELQAVSEKLLYATSVRTQLVNGGATPPTTLVYRKKDGNTSAIVANNETSLEPGDVVEVTLLLSAAGTLDSPQFKSTMPQTLAPENSSASATAAPGG